MIPTWLIGELDTRGLWNTDGVTRAARYVWCEGCSTWTVTGLDDAKCAWAVRADAAPLSAAGEALALLAGRPTYRLARFAGRLELDHRHQWDVAGRPAEGGAYDVLVEHRCDATPLPRTRSRLQPPARTSREAMTDAPF